MLVIPKRRLSREESALPEELMKRYFLPAVVAVLCLASAFAERPGNFKIIGPGGGGAMFHPTISPHDSQYRAHRLRYDRFLHHS